MALPWSQELGKKYRTRIHLGNGKRMGRMGLRSREMDVAIVHLTPSVMEMLQHCERKVPGYRK